MKGCKKMKRTFDYIGILKIAAVQVVIFFLVMIFFNIESVWTLIVGLALVVVLVVLSKAYKQQSASIIEFFTANKPTVLTVLIVLLFLYPLIGPLMIRQNTYWLLILIQTGIYMILALGLNIQLGSTGVLNLAVAAFYGIGGYTAGLLSLRLGVPSIITLPLGGIVAALFGMVLYVPLYKTKGHYIPYSGKISTKCPFLGALRVFIDMCSRRLICVFIPNRINIAC